MVWDLVLRCRNSNARATLRATDNLALHLNGVLLSPAMSVDIKIPFIKEKSR